MAYHAYDYYSSMRDLPEREAHWRATVDNIVACAERAEPKQYYEIFRFAPAPDSAVARMLPPGLLARCLDHVEAAQDDDGGWHDEHGLSQWRAYTTILALHGLRAHGRNIGALSSSP